MTQMYRIFNRCNKYTTDVQNMSQYVYATGLINMPKVYMICHSFIYCNTLQIYGLCQICIEYAIYLQNLTYKGRICHQSTLCLPNCIEYDPYINIYREILLQQSVKNMPLMYITRIYYSCIEFVTDVQDIPNVYRIYQSCIYYITDVFGT